MPHQPQAGVAGLAIARKKGDKPEPVESLSFDANGVVGDRHAGPGLRQVSLMSDLVVTRLAGNEGHAQPGSGDENVAVSELEHLDLRVLDTLELGSATLEITAIGPKVSAHGKELCEHADHCAMGDFGVFARVITPGDVRVGAPVAHHRRKLRTHIVTLSDRASRGKYADESGPRVETLLGEWATAHGFEMAATRSLLADDTDALQRELDLRLRTRTDLIVTTGSTGIGPRDIAPEIIQRTADKTIPGIMEMVRMKYGADKPFALLSRSVAATKGETLILALPGTPRAVDEYLGVITPLLEHLMLTIKGIDAH